MGLAYDFDIVTIAPKGDGLENTGPKGPENKVVRARFRDVKTADALRGASPRIRRIFLDAGFTLDSHGGGESHGYYPLEDAAERNRILRRLFANMRSAQLKGEYCGAFDLRDFLAHIRSAKPRVENQKSRPLPAEPPDTAAHAEQYRKTVTGRIGFALGLAVIVFVLLKYLAAAGATP